MYPSGKEFWRLLQEGVLTEATPQTEGVKGLGPGERAAINLALERRSWILLRDDRRPFREAMGLGLKVLCTPVLAVELYSEGRLGNAEVMEVPARLTAMQRVSPGLMGSAIAQLGRVWKGE